MGTAVAVALHVLFIGNSLTAANDLPRLVEQLGRAAGIAIHCEAIAKPNFSLDDHLADGEAKGAIARQKWDVVVLQQGPSALPESRTLLLNAARQLDAAIRAAGARPALFMVWPSAQRAADFDRVSESYRLAAEAIRGTLLPAGDAWRAAWRRDPKIQLYGPDGFHPSVTGSWLAALVIFEGVTGQRAPRIEMRGVAMRDAETLRAATSDVGEFRGSLSGSSRRGSRVPAR